MTWIRAMVQTVHMAVLVVACGVLFYSLTVTSQHSPPSDHKTGALTVIESDDYEDGLVEFDDTESEIQIENPEPFIPTNEWQTVKPGQAIPRGLHVRLNLETGLKEARLLEDTDEQQEAADSDQAGQQQYTLEELKHKVKAMKSEKFKATDMETLKREKKLRSRSELKADLDRMQADIKTDSELVTEMVEKLKTASPEKDDLTNLLEQLEYYLHQIDNALLFCDLGAMPRLLRCLNNSDDSVRALAALTMGAALQSNPKVQVSAVESGGVREVLRLLALDHSPTVRRRSLYALSTLLRHFPYAQKRFMELGGLSVLAALFQAPDQHQMQVRAVTLLADLVKEKTKHFENYDPGDVAQVERIRQYEEVSLMEAVAETGWCPLISSLLQLEEHDSREKVLVAMETLTPACLHSFRDSVKTLETIRQQYLRLQELDEEDGDDDGFFKGLALTAERLLTELTKKEEL